MRIEQVEHFIVEVMVRADRTMPNGRPHWEWLSVDNQYPSHTTIKARAKRFKEPPAIEEIAKWSGMPWYSQHDRRFKPRIWRVVETRTEDLV